jgi:hypothetical protein
VERQTDLIGRDRELSELKALLDAPRGSLALVTGPLGMGKSTLFGALADHARQDGWRVVGDADGARLTIHPDATETSVAERLRELLRLDPLHAAAVRPPPKRGRAGFPSPAGKYARTYSPALGDLILSLAPVLIIVDGYWPPPELERRLISHVLPQLRPGRVVLGIAADEEASTERLAAEATCVLRLGPLDEVAVRALLESAAASCTPLTARETETYVRAAANEPRLLLPLRRVLGMRAPTAGRAASRP